MNQIPVSKFELISKFVQVVIDPRLLGIVPIATKHLFYTETITNILIPIKQFEATEKVKTFDSKPKEVGIVPTTNALG